MLLNQIHSFGSRLVALAMSFANYVLWLWLLWGLLPPGFYLASMVGLPTKTKSGVPELSYYMRPL